jgi:hypothetical protein
MRTDYRLLFTAYCSLLTAHCSLPRHPFRFTTASRAPPLKARYHARPSWIRPVLDWIDPGWEAYRQLGSEHDSLNLS